MKMVWSSPAPTVSFASAKRKSPQLRSTLIAIGQELLALLEQPPSSRRDALFALGVQRAARLGFNPIFQGATVTWEDAA